MIEHTPAHIVGKLLETMELVAGQGPLVTPPAPGAPWPCYKEHFPDKATGVAVYTTTGIQDGRAMDDGERYEHPGIQVVVYGPNHDAGYKHAAKIQALLSKPTLAMVSIEAKQYRISCFRQTSNIIPLGALNDTDTRRAFSLNGTVTIQEI